MLHLAKNAVKALPYPLFLRAFLAWHAATQQRHAEAKRRRLGLPLISELDWNAYRKSDTLFILGSGPSINAIPAERWGAIARHDSIGFNFWPYHSHVPTLYYFEAADPVEWPHVYVSMLALFRERAGAYRHVPKIISELQRAHHMVPQLPPEWRENLYCHLPITLAARTPEEFGAGLRYVARSLALQRAFRRGRLFKYVSSLSALVPLAMLLGYRQVVLCGIDLHNQEYFYQDERLYPASASFTPEPKAQKHLAFREVPWLVKLNAVLREMNAVLLRPAGIELYVESRTSALWPEIPEVPPSVFA